jgi:mono/diheme cytochrome c family protein
LEIVGVVLVVGVVGLAIYVAGTWDRVWDDVPIPNVQASTDPEVIKRGEYFVYGPSHCVECHAGTWAAFQKVIDGEQVPLRGGLAFPAAPLGTIYSRNLTPDPETGIGRYSDGQLARMMRYSVRPDGKAVIQLMMPFHNMSDEDLVAIISYLRAQAPVRHEVPENDYTVIGKVIKSLVPLFKPRPADAVHPPATSPPEAPTKERGEYLARYVGNCDGCHTKHDQLTFSPVVPEFSGGEEMEPAALPGADPKEWYRSPNLTPGKGTVFSKFVDRATWIARFKVGGRHHAGSPMPWESFSRMSDADLGALYEFFKTLPPADGPTGEPNFRRAE